MNTELQNRVSELRAAKRSFRQIGAILDIPTTRARDAFRAAQRHRQQRARWCAGLSVRVANLLLTLGYTNRQQVRRDLKKGKLAPAKTASYGPAAHREIRRWLGIVEIENQSRTRECIAYLQKLGYQVIPQEES